MTSTSKTSKKSNKTKGIIGLIIALVVVLLGGVLFIGAVSGWFDDLKIVLDAEYCTDEPQITPITPDEYQSLSDAHKSFLILVTQPGCKTAVNLKTYATDYIKERGLNIYEMDFSDLKKTSLYDTVKYYSSFIVISKGKVKAFLDAESNEHAPIYNSYEDFKAWLDLYI